MLLLLLVLVLFVSAYTCSHTQWVCNHFQCFFVCRNWVLSYSSLSLHIVIFASNFHTSRVLLYAASQLAVSVFAWLCSLYAWVRCYSSCERSCMYWGSQAYKSVKTIPTKLPNTQTHVCVLCICKCSQPFDSSGIFFSYFISFEADFILCSAYVCACVLCCRVRVVRFRSFYWIFSSILWCIVWEVTHTHMDPLFF